MVGLKGVTIYTKDENGNTCGFWYPRPKPPHPSVKGVFKYAKEIPDSDWFTMEDAEDFSLYMERKDWPRSWRGWLKSMIKYRWKLKGATPQEPERW